MTRLAVGVIGMNVVIAYPSHKAAMAAIEGPLCFDPRHATLARDLPSVDAFALALYQVGVGVPKHRASDEWYEEIARNLRARLAVPDPVPAAVGSEK